MVRLSRCRAAFGVFFICVLPLVYGKEDSIRRCDPEFRTHVQNCMGVLEGFPIFTRQRTLQLGNWAQTDVICRFKLMRAVTLCLTSLYALTPNVKIFRSLCGFQNLDPELLLKYTESVCKHKEVLKQHSSCLNLSLTTCGLSTCLSEFDPSLNSQLSTGMWKSPRYSLQCSYHAYAEHCHEKHLFGQCPVDAYYAQMDILKATRPFSCSYPDMDRLKKHFRDSEIYVILPSASDWLHGTSRVSWNVIGAVVATVIAMVIQIVLGIG